MTLILVGGRGRSAYIPPSFGEWAPNLSTYTAQGLTLFSDDDMDALSETEGAPNANGLAWFNMSNPSATDVTAPNSSAILRHPTPGNSLGGGFGSGLWEIRALDLWKRGYFCAAMKLVGSGGEPYRIHNNEEKFFYPIQRFDSDNSEAGVATQFAFRGDVPDLLWDWHCDAQNGDPRFYQNTSVTCDPDNVWNMFEMYIQMNTLGNADGIWKMWINGGLAADISNIEYNKQGSTTSWSGTRMSNVRGGGDDVALTPAGGQARYFDRMTFYTSASL